MRRVRRLRRRRTEAAELNITAFMNLMVILVPFLLITAVFSRLAILELNLPTGDAAEAEQTEPELALEITVRDAAIEVGDHNQGLLTRIDRTEEGHDFGELEQYLRRIKSRFPDKSDATVLLEPDIPYQTLVEVMDAVRVAEVVDDETSSVTKTALFPEIAIGDAPAVN